MIKKIAWEAFKNTGDINMYLELKQIENIEDKIEKNDLNTRNEKIQENQLSDQHLLKQLIELENKNKA